MAAASTVFGEVPAAPADPILGITESFKACNAAEKLNLGVGAYRDDNLQPVVLEARATRSWTPLRPGLRPRAAA